MLWRWDRGNTFLFLSRIFLNWKHVRRGMSAYNRSTQLNRTKNIPVLNISYCTTGKPLLWKQFPQQGCLAQQPCITASRSYCQAGSDNACLYAQGKWRAAATFISASRQFRLQGRPQTSEQTIFSCQPFRWASKAQEDLLLEWHSSSIQTQITLHLKVGATSILLFVAMI